MKHRTYRKEINELLRDGSTFDYFPSHQSAYAWTRRICRALEESTGMYASVDVVKVKEASYPWRASVHGAYNG